MVYFSFMLSCHVSVFIFFFLLGVFGFDHSVNPLVLLPGVRCSSSTHSDDGHFEEKKHSDDGIIL
jgi:hypothetical protein